VQTQASLFVLSFGDEGKKKLCTSNISSSDGESDISGIVDNMADIMLDDDAKYDGKNCF